MANDLDSLFDDERAHAIFLEVFNPADDNFDPERDENLFDACVAKIVALGYSHDDATEYMNAGLIESTDLEEADA